MFGCVEIFTEAYHRFPTWGCDRKRRSRRARWCGIVDDVEGNYISDGSKLVLVDRAEGKAVKCYGGVR